jgi:hypothetical protein
MYIDDKYLFKPYLPLIMKIIVSSICWESKLNWLGFISYWNRKVTRLLSQGWITFFTYFSLVICGFGLVVKYLGVDGLFLFFLHYTSLCISCDKNLVEFLMLCFVLWASCFSFLSIKFYVCTWIDLLFVNNI